MRIAVIGTGYVGAVTGTCLADLGNEVTFVDIDERKLAMIREGTPPIFEPGLAELLRKNRHRISVTGDLDRAVRTSDLTMISVGTPSRDDGSIDLSYVTGAAKEIGAALTRCPGFHTVVTKSTVIPGTSEDVIRPILEQYSGKTCGEQFGLASNPEFLKEGSAVEDFFHPDRIIIGAQDANSRAVLETLYSSFTCPKLVTGIKTAEMIKYASNAFLATKISFANEVGNICKELGIDTAEVFQGVGMDTRIGPAFFRSGIGFGGSCFPKDVRALISLAKEKGVSPSLLNAVVSVNESQPERMIPLLKKHLDIKGKTIGVLGLAFKPDTDDIRESRAIPVIAALLREGCRVIAYDPLAMDAFRAVCPDISYTGNPDEVLKADAILIVTEWKEFEMLDYRGKTVIDGRRMSSPRRDAKIYEGVCW
ncbi:MAG: UDP-glucose/GDP-mannose dehydrogenase family protein [Methanoregulaceae archaeon]